MRKYLALGIFVASVFLFVTLQNMVLIHEHKEMIDGKMSEYTSQSQGEIPKIDIKHLGLEIRDLSATHHLENNIFNLNHTEYSAVEAYELNMEFTGQYEHICDFLQDIEKIDQARTQEVAISKAQNKEGSHDLTIKMNFVGAL